MCRGWSNGLGQLLAQTSSMNGFTRIDVHHHAFPPALQATKEAGSGALGWKMTAEGRHWSLEVSLGAMEKLKIDKAILSLPSGYPPDQKDVREANEELKRLCDRYPTRFGFWASLGDLRNTKGMHVLPLNWLTILRDLGPSSHPATVATLWLIPSIASTRCNRRDKICI